MTVEGVKEALRIRSSTFDGEISVLMDAARRDLAACGVGPEMEPDALYGQAIIAYCKAHFGVDDEGVAERWSGIYRNLAQHMALCATYNGGD